MTDETEIAWAAGLFDGEGCCYKERPTNGVNSIPRLAVTQKKGQLLERFQAAVGEGSISPVRRDGARQWWVTHSGAVRAIGRLWPYLSEIKREQIAVVARSVLEEWKPAGNRGSTRPKWHVELIDYNEF